MSKYSRYSEIDPEFEAIQKDVDDAVSAMWKLPLAEMKEESFKDLPMPQSTPRIPEDVQIDDIQIPTRDGGEITVRVYRARDTPANAILNISYHGGGWTTGKHTYEEATNRHVAFSKKAVVISPLYRLAPEHPFPRPFEDCVDTLKWAIDNGTHELGVDTKRIIISGSSAGGNLTAAIALYARDQQIPGIIGQVLNIPAVCHPDFSKMRTGSQQTSLDEHANASVLSLQHLLWFWTQYVGNNPERDTRHSPLLAESLAGLPPALIQVAGLDPLRDEGIEYGEALEAAGNKVQTEIFKGVPHGFGSIIDVGASRKYQENVVGFIKAIDEGTFSGGF